MYLVSVYFDDKTSGLLENYIEKVAKRTGNDFMLAHQVPSHMTISQIEAKNVELLIPYMELLEGKLSSGEIQFVSVGMLLPYVIYVTPVLNEYLITLSKQVHEVFSDIPETTISKYYMPHSWLPHVTIGKTLSKKQMQTAFEVMQESFAPFTAQVIEIGLARVNPHEDVVRWRMG